MGQSHAAAPFTFLRQPQPQWRALLALTSLNARYEDSFETCAALPCRLPADRVTVPAGNRIAGTMAKSGFASLAWRPLPSTELAAHPDKGITMSKPYNTTWVNRANQR